MEQLKSIKQCLVNTVQNQLNDLNKVNAKELGEVVDMIKDLEEAMYYCSIIQAMERSKEQDEEKSTHISYYMEGDHGTHHYVPYMEYAPYMIRDKQWREDHLDNNGRSYYSRRMYMEGKMNGSDTTKELEHYVKDLGEDLTEMVVKSTPEEKQVLSNKLQQLAMKVAK